MANSNTLSSNAPGLNASSAPSSPVLEGFEVISRVDGKPYQCSINVLNISAIDAVLNVQDETVRHITDSSLYYPDTREVFEASLSEHGLIIGCLVNKRLVAFRSIWFPRSRPENLGLDIGMQDPDQLSQVAHLERACVIPEFTGNRLQMRMTRHAINLAKQNSSFRYLFSTVAPMNYASMQDKFSADMLILKLVKKYEDYYRYIFFQDVIKPIEVNLQHPSSIIFANGKDIEAQVSLLKQNDLMVGCMQQRNGDAMQVGYAEIEHALF